MVSESRRRAVQVVVFFGVIASVWGLVVALTVLYNVPQGLPDDRNESITSTSLNCTGRVCNASKLVCSDGFYVGDEAGLPGCRPECGEWEEFPHATTLAFDVVMVLQAVVSVVSTVILVVLSAIRYKQMFKFPSMFIIYGTFPVTVFEIFVLIGYTNRQSLFCSSRDLIESLKCPTAFCSLQGAVFFYCVFQLTLLWICHIVVIFYGIKFPFHSKNMKKRGHFRYLHVSHVLLSLMLPVIPVAVGFGTGGYTMPRFPPTVCLAISPDATFYSFVLPVSFISALGVSLIIGMFCILYDMNKNHATPSENAQGQVPRNWKAEIKLLVIFSYAFGIFAFSLIAFTITLRNWQIFETQLMAYFLCESMGVVSGNNCERSFERFGNEAFLVISFIFLGFYPAVSLIYVVNIKELKKICYRRKEITL